MSSPLLLELFFLVAVGITFLASISIVYFLRVFDRLFEKEIFEKAYPVMSMFLLSIMFHTFYHVGGDFLKSDSLENFFEFLALVSFLIGIVYLSRTIMQTHISFEAHRRLQNELDRMTEEMKNYVASLERSNQLKDLFTDIISHDLKNPLGVIVNYSDMMTTFKEEFTEENVKAIERNAEKSLEMIDSATVFSKLQDPGRITFSKLDLGEIVRKEIENLEELSARKDIRLKYDLTGKYPIKAAQLINQIFSNLISNAIKYSPENREIDIEIEDGGKYWRVFVKDRGEGISDKYKQSIFERFERLEKKGVKGTGIGLAIVKRIVKMHNGLVWMEDNPGGGSVFIVELPKKQ